jgi:hypothetical protein
VDYAGFVSGSYETLAVTADAEDLYNWYVERMESQGATTMSTLYPTPGVTLLSAGTSGVGRAHFVANSREFCVIGTTFCEGAMLGGLTVHGTVSIGTTPATISYNGDGGNQLFITSGENGYIYDMTTDVVTQVAALNGKASMGDHLDGYFLALDANTSTLYISNLLDGLTWTTGTDFAQRSQAADPWISMKVNGKYIWLLGELTTEVWYNTGASFPFAPHPSGLIQYGIAAGFSRTIVGSAMAWLGTSASGSRYVLQASGFSPEVVSSLPQQLAMSRYGTVSDAIADSYTQLGHTFYVLHFPTERVTWAWDSTTGLWAKRGTWIEEDGEYVGWRAMFHAYAFGESRMLDPEKPNVYTLDPAVGTDVDDRVIRRLRRAPTLEGENTRIYFSSLELDLEPGLGAVTGQGSNPLVMMRSSNDGGKTWSAESFRTAGALGNYSTRVRWNRQGAARRRVYEISVSDPVPWRITAAYLALGQAPRKQGQAAVQA